MKKGVIFVWTVLMSLRVFAQEDSVRERIILIGDAGEIDEQQNKVAAGASSMVLPGHTTVFYLGDNIYPAGMGLPGSPEEKSTRRILRAQYQPFRAKGARVFFIPGNHDWDHMRKNGLAKIKAQWQFLEDQHDSLLQEVPGNGCPGPVAIPLSDKLVVIAFDSEWWVFTHNKDNPQADCECNNKDAFIARLQDLFYQNRDKMILIADHHPFQSYGHHGGYYTLKDHIFPLTEVNKNLYIPLPVIGSLYPGLRRLIVNPEDLRHPLYRDMIRRIDGVFDSFPNLIHVAGHEHGMQLIKNKSHLQVVSGAGAKQAYVKKGKNALCAEMAPGFVAVDQLTGNSLRFTWYTREHADTQLVARFTYRVPYSPVKEQRARLQNHVSEDSITVAAHPGYDSVDRLHKKIFGNNYRKEWAAPTRLPVLRISQLEGGLTPTGRGGGHQSLSLRLKDSSGKEWVLRSVNKFPEQLLPEALRQTFAGDVINDAMSAQHPYSALIVPPLAEATGVPHANPVIGWVAPDERLGSYESKFAGTINLFEEREPQGKADSGPKMISKLQEDNDNDFDSTGFLKAKLLDVLINDWDRHDDQWRFHGKKNSAGGKTYVPVPRDRDQAFYTNQGVIPFIASRPWLLFYMQDVARIRNINDLMQQSAPLNDRFLTQFSPAAWNKIVSEFVKALPDTVLSAAVSRLPAASRDIGQKRLLRDLISRRNALPAEMSRYYRFLNRVVELPVSDKNESVLIRDGLQDDGRAGLQVKIQKISKKGIPEQVLFDKVFDPAITKEIRIYSGAGNDEIKFNSARNRIRLRLITGAGEKKVDVEKWAGRATWYAKTQKSVDTGADRSKLKIIRSDDSANTAYVPVNLYNKAAPLATAGYNLDDGIILGLGLKFINQGFRRTPWANIQELTIAHSFSTDAFRVRYQGQWKAAVGKADFVLTANAFAPDNTQNYFGRGNETPFLKNPGYLRFYRARFNLYNITPMLRWGTSSQFSVGPTLAFYHFDDEDNEGRLILQPGSIHGYDSSTIGDDKSHAGLQAIYTLDKRDHPLLTRFGHFLSVKLQAQAGLNKYSSNFSQITGEFALYRPLNDRRTVVLSNRVGGGLSFGKTAFYQSLFLDGKENLMGYRQFRFAGQDMIYNNLELRVKLTDLADYLLAGELGITAFYDIGRVWETDEISRKWHNGVGGGFYFSPAALLLIRASVGYSPEGWYPYLGFGFRF